MGSAGANDVGHVPYHVASPEAQAELMDMPQLSSAEMDEIHDIMRALGRLRDAERRLMDETTVFMRLSETDMRALHFVMGCENRGLAATPGMIANHLGVSAASTTKLLDRLERGNHVVRHPHPTDRRALVVTVSAETRRAATQSVGRQQARRVYAAARLSSSERAVVSRFLDDMATELLSGDRDWHSEVT